MGRPRRRSPLTSEAARGLVQIGIDPEEAAVQAAGSGLRISRATFYRALGASVQNPVPLNQNILAFFFKVRLANEASEETSLRFREAHMTAGGLWKLLLINLELADQAGVRAATSEILTTLPPYTDSPLVALVRGQGCLHAALVRAAELGERTEVAEMLGRAEVSLRCDVFEPLHSSYKGLVPEAFLTKLDAGGKKPDVRDVAHADCMGVVLSTAMHSQLYIARQTDEARWKEVIDEFAEAGVLPQLCVRGVVFGQPVPMLNAAEAFHGRRQETEARLVMDHLMDHIMQDPSPLLDSDYDPSFVAWALAYIAAKLCPVPTSGHLS